MTLTYINTKNLILYPAKDILMAEGYTHKKNDFLRKLFHSELENSNAKNESLEDVIKRNKAVPKPSSSTDEESADGVAGGRVLNPTIPER